MLGGEITTTSGFFHSGVKSVRKAQLYSLVGGCLLFRAVRSDPPTTGGRQGPTRTKVNVRRCTHCCAGVGSKSDPHAVEEIALTSSIAPCWDGQRTKMVNVTSSLPVYEVCAELLFQGTSGSKVVYEKLKTQNNPEKANQELQLCWMETDPKMMKKSPLK